MGPKEAQARREAAMLTICPACRETVRGWVMAGEAAMRADPMGVLNAVGIKPTVRGLPDCGA